MARPKVLQQQNFNGLIIFFIIIMIMGVGWGWLIEVKAGEIYGKILAILSFIIIFLSLAINEQDKKTMKDFAMSPITSNTNVAIFSFLIGWIAITGINIVGRISGSLGFQAFSTTNFFGSIFFSGSGLSEGISQTFQASIVESSLLSSFYYSSIVAPITEEIGWLWILPLLFYTLALTLFNGINKTIALPIKNTTFALWMSLLLSAGTFMFIHNLNASYVGGMFLVAGAFRLLINSSVYIYGFVLSFGIGMHMANNTFAFVSIHGLGTTLSTLLLNPYGYIFLIPFISLIIYTIVNFDNVYGDFQKSRRGV